MPDPIDDRAYQLELARLALDRARFRYEVFKWLIVAIGALGSFYLIDLARLHLEQFRATTENERALLNAYLTASDTVEPEVWVRKLELIQTLSIDPALQGWAGREILYVQSCSAKAVVYQETLRVAASLLDPHAEASERATARRRFEQLYWADLPYVHESKDVEQTMVDYRKALVAAETDSPAGSVPDLNVAMIHLSGALRGDDPKKDAACGRAPPA